MMTAPRRLAASIVARLAAAIVVAVVLAGPARTAWAHATLVEAAPADGAVLAQMPDRIVLRFNETVTPVFVRVLGPGGGEVAPVAGPEAVDRTIRVTLPAGSPPGSYLVSWRVVSADAHPIGGALAFAIGSTAPPAAAVDESQARNEAVWKAAVIVNRALGDLALLLAAGGVLCIVFVFERRVPARFPLHGAIRIAAAVASASAALAVGFAGGWLTAAPAAAFFDPATWQAGAGTGALARAAGSLLGAASVAAGTGRLHRRTGLALAVGGAVVAAASVALSGHVAALTPAWPAQIALALHAVAVAFWLGSLWPLHLAVRHLPVKEAARRLQRFSAIAVPAVALLIAAGAGVALTRVTSIESLIGTRYGQLLAFKVALAGAMLALAARNRWLARRYVPAKSGLRDPLARNVRLEIALAAGILIVSAFLSHTPPGQAPRDEAHDDHGGHAVDVSVRDERRGHALRLAFTALDGSAYRVVATLADAAGRPLAPREVTVELANRDAGVERLSRALAASGPGAFTLERIDLPIGGRWQVRLDALIDDFEKVVFEAEVDLPSM
jgi:copper transport protein